MKTFLLLLVLSSFTDLAINGMAQETSPIEVKSPKNLLYGTVGIAPGLGFAYSAFAGYERQLLTGEMKVFNSLNYRSAIGITYDGDTGGFDDLWLVQSMTYLTGQNARHFEFSPGVTYAFDWGQWFPTVAMGYRKDVSTNSIIRVGAGFPEYIYFSYGGKF